MKSYEKKLMPCAGMNEEAFRKLESFDPLFFEFDSQQQVIQLFNLDRQMIGICQRDFVPEFLSLSARKWEFSFSVKEMTSDNNVDSREVFLVIGAYAPGEVTKVLRGY